MSKYNCFKNHEKLHRHLTSPSHAIDQMISLVVFDHAEMKKVIAMNEPELTQQKFVRRNVYYRFNLLFFRTTFRSLQSRRKRRIALRR